MPDQSVYDTRLSSNLKKFNSERNLFFTNLYNSDINAKTNSFLKGTLKKCKSYKDFFQKSTDEDYNKSPNRVQSYNLDETDKNYLFSDRRRNTVKELRKNFENKINSNENKNTIKNTKKCEFSACDLKKSISRAKSLDRHSFYLHETESIIKPTLREKNKPPVCKKPKPEDLDFYDYSKSNFILLPKAYTISSRGNEDNLYRDYLQEISSFAYPHRNKRCNSVNGIDLDILKNELNDYVDPKLRRSRYDCSYGLRQRTNRFNTKVNSLSFNKQLRNYVKEN